MSDAYAHHVVLRRTSDYLPGKCAAWVESADRECGKPADGILCARHQQVARRRAVVAAEKWRSEKVKRAAYKAAQLEKYGDQWRAELARVEAEINRRDPPGHPDRAAYGGAVHPSIMRRQQARLSDSNVQRMAWLWRRKGELQALLGETS